MTISRCECDVVCGNTCACLIIDSRSFGIECVASGQGTLVGESGSSLKSSIAVRNDLTCIVHTLLQFDVHVALTQHATISAETVTI